MTDNTRYFSELKQETSAYIKDRLLLLKLRAAKEISALAGILIVAVCLLFLGFFCLLFLGITVAMVLGNILHSMIAAYAIVIVLYIAMLWLIVANRKRLTERFLSSAIKIAFPKASE